MRPITLAQKEYEGTDGDFTVDLARYLSRGFVYSGDEAFIMARTMAKEDLHRWSDWEYQTNNPDTWFVFLAAGRNKLNRFQELAPFQLDNIAWHRRDDCVIRVYEWNKFKRKSNYGIPKSPIQRLRTRAERHA